MATGEKSCFRLTGRMAVKIPWGLKKLVIQNIFFEYLYVIIQLLYVYVRKIE